jgi:transcriptional regulator with XRE-family HTH domain
LPSCDIFLIESGQIIPSVGDLEKLAQALEVPLYQLFCDAEESPKLPNLLNRKTADELWLGESGSQESVSSSGEEVQCVLTFSKGGHRARPVGGWSNLVPRVSEWRCRIESPVSKPKIQDRKAPFDSALYLTIP